MSNLRRAFSMGCLWLAAACLDAAEPPQWPMIALTLRGRRIEGSPIAWTAQEVRLLGRDGRLWRFPPEEASDFHKTASGFRGYSPSEFRAELLRALGAGYEVSGTGHYLVAHPAGRRDRWAERFEELYRSFVHYFSVRGFECAAPPFPLVGIVCRDRAEFDRHAAARLGGPTDGVLGFYDIETNRIMLYDMGARADSSDWRKNASVLIHEATHQTAFNTGVHSRYRPPPLWLAEGLATLFEAPGVYDPRGYPRLADRVNRRQLEAFRRVVAPRHRPELPAALAAADSLFRRDPTAAYAEAWAMSFFLVETSPRKFAAYLKRTAARSAFEDYSAAERTADFTAEFGDDWRMLEAQMLRFLAAVE